MRTDTEMMNLILQIADTLEVEAIALSGSRTNPQAPTAQCPWTPSSVSHAL